MAILAPSLRRLEAEVNRQFRGRDEWSDGWMGDSAHSHRVSDHNPDRGVVHAYDFDATMRHAMGSGPVGDFIAARVLSLCRGGRLRNVVNYVIYKRVIYTRERNFRGARYTGINPHDSHVHISILHTPFARGFSGSWGIALPTIDASRVEWAFSGHPSAAPDNLRRVQARLEDKGLLRPPYRHGFAGPKTRSAVRKWQVRNDYKADGRPGFWQLVKLSGGHYRVVR